MAPPAKVKISRLEAAPADEATGWTPLTGLERAVPVRFVVAAELSEPQCAVHLDVRIEGGAPVVHELTVARLGPPWGPPVSASVLRRVALDSLIRSAIDEVAEPMVVRDDVEGYEGRLVYQLQRDVDAGRSDIAYVGPPARPPTGTGRRTSDEVLRQVASLYRSAERAPTQAVADKLHVSRSHAGRLVAQARAAGHLGTTKPGKAGEQR